MTDQLHLQPRHRRMLEELLREHLPDVEVWAYGSRVTGRSHGGSDLDLVLRGPWLEKIPMDQLTDFEEALRESNIPFLVEARDWARVPEEFRREIRIKRGHVVLSNGKNAFSSRRVRVKSVGEVCLGVTSGGTPSRRNASFFDNGLWPWLKTQELQDGWLDDSEEHITEAAIASCSARVLPAKTILMAMYGATVGRLGILRRPMTCNQACCAMMVDPEQADYRYLFYSLLHARPQIRDLATGAAQQNLSGKVIRSLQFAFPPLPEQRAIAHVLGTLDDKIGLNRRINETLEAMARALFKSWFVNFEPVRAKMAGRDTGLPEDIANLFPDRLVDSEMEEIPEGWEAKTLKDCMSLTMGQSPPGSTYNDRGEGLPFFQGRSEFGFRYPKKQRFCSRPSRVAYPEDTLVSVRAPVGDINLAWERCCIGRGVAALRHNSGSSSYTYHSAWALWRQLVAYEHTGTVFGAINKGQFEALKVTEPDLRVVDAFDAMAGSLDARIRSNVEASRILAALRDTLLPKLISGDIRIPHVQKLVGAIA